MFNKVRVTFLSEFDKPDHFSMGQRTEARFLLELAAYFEDVDRGESVLRVSDDLGGCDPQPVPEERRV